VLTHSNDNHNNKGQNKTLNLKTRFLHMNTARSSIKLKRHTKTSIKTLFLHMNTARSSINLSSYAPMGGQRTFPIHKSQTRHDSSERFVLMSYHLQKVDLFLISSRQRLMLLSPCCLSRSPCEFFFLAFQSLPFLWSLYRRFCYI